jgi:hypothetical protein
MTVFMQAAKRELTNERASDRILNAPSSLPPIRPTQRVPQPLVARNAQQAAKKKAHCHPLAPPQFPKFGRRIHNPEIPRITNRPNTRPHSPLIFLVDTQLGFVHINRCPRLHGNRIFAIEPATQIDQLAAITAERIRLIRRRIGDRLFADGAKGGRHLFLVGFGRLRRSRGRLDFCLGRRF